MTSFSCSVLRSSLANPCHTVNIYCFLKFLTEHAGLHPNTLSHQYCSRTQFDNRVRQSEGLSIKYVTLANSIYIYIYIAWGVVSLVPWEVGDRVPQPFCLYMYVYG